MNTIPIMVNGLPGRMATEVVEAALSQPECFDLWPFSFCGPEIERQTCQVGDMTIQLISEQDRETWLKDKKEGKFPIIVDFTIPSAVQQNVEFYCQQGLDFILGTTGGDYQWIQKRIEQSQACAVVAPNMSTPILLMQAAFEFLATQFPGALDGWQGQIVESHQAGKRDTSGTAKKMVEYLQALDVAVDVASIEKIRDPEIQRDRLQVPEEYLKGHAYHTYSLQSPDKTVELQFTHNVLGRATYATGTLAAVRFLAERRVATNHGISYNMLDVLRATGEK